MIRETLPSGAVRVNCCQLAKQHGSELRNVCLKANKSVSRVVVGFLPVFCLSVSAVSFVDTETQIRETCECVRSLAEMEE